MQTIDAHRERATARRNIPWVVGGHTDPWNLVEAAMARRRPGSPKRNVPSGSRAAALRRFAHAYYQGNAVEEHSARHQRHVLRRERRVAPPLASGDTGFLEHMFPVVERAIDFALDQQYPTGEIEWDADPERVEGKGALLTGSSSIYSSLRCAIAAAERLGRERPDWELSLGSLAIAIAHRPETLPSQGALGDGLVLPDPRRRAARARGRRRIAAKWKRVRRRNAACAGVCRINHGSPRRDV
jgi:hypothetical protein